MREGRNKVLKTDLQIKKTVWIKSIILTIIIDIMAIAFLLLLGIKTEEMWKYFIFLIFLIDIICLISLYILILQEEEGKRSKIFAKKYLSVEKFVEVIPINAYRYSKFILGLTDIAKFYATINEKGDKVEIRIKFNNESESRYLEQIYSCYFIEYYRITNDNEQGKKE